MQDIERLVYKMLTTNTGVHMMDSGGADGRGWQRNQKKTLADFKNEPSVAPFDEWELKDIKDSSDLSPTVSLFHHLVNSLELDDTCKAFNRLKCADWDSEQAYGLSLRGERFLADNDLVVGDTWNSYNGECNLSQTVQGANVTRSADTSNFEFPEYILLQVHNGADVRGGYTDAKLFKVGYDYFDVNPTVYGTIDGVEVDTAYNGYNLTNENGASVDCTPDSKIELYLSEQ